MTSDQAASLKFFAPAEWKHPELVDYDFAVYLDDVRRVYGWPLTVTSDARTVQENTAASGSSPTSLHLRGRAVDLRWIADPAALFRLVAAAIRVANGRPMELEFVSGPTDHHLHLGLFDDPHHASTLLVATD